MTSNTHGGARPKVREDDGRSHNGGARTGAGPKPKKATLELGSVHYTHVRTSDGKQAGATMMLEVTKVDRDCLELTDRHTGNIYHLVR